MPFKKGHIKTGGRKKGTLNKKTIEDLGRAEAILQLIENEYLEDDLKKLSSSQRSSLYSDLLEYRAPKLSRVDTRISANVHLTDSPITFE